MSLRQQLRRVLPPSVVAPLRRTETYAKRLLIWRRISRAVRGVGADDRAALRRSALHAPISAARSLDKWADPLLLDDALVEVAGVGRFQLRARSDDLWHVLPSREPDITQTLQRLLRPGDTFVDAGANIGFYSVLASRLVGATGRVTAFEMMPDTAAILRRHLEMNGADNVELIERALSERAGDTIEAYVTEGKFGQATIAPREKGRKISVETTTLDAALAHLPSIRLMKMDIEGAEELALRGARETLARIEHLIFESWSTGAEVEALLGQYGFKVRALDGRNRIASKD